LDQALTKLKGVDLDAKITAYQEAVRLHADCIEHLEKVRKSLAQPLVAVEWRGFGCAKQEIEHLYTLVDTASSLTEKVSAYRALIALAEEYERRLQSAQTSIASVSPATSSSASSTDTSTLSSPSTQSALSSTRTEDEV
jgi:exonuclease VII small subunit